MNGCNILIEITMEGLENFKFVFLIGPLEL